MPNQLSLSSNENPDMADAMMDCKPGDQCTFMVAGKINKNAKGEMVMDVDSAECQDNGMGEGETPEKAPAPKKPGKPMAAAVSKAGMMMA